MSRIGNFLRSMMGPDEQHEAAVLMELRKTQAFGVLPMSQDTGRMQRMALPRTLGNVIAPS